MAEAWGPWRYWPDLPAEGDWVQVDGQCALTAAPVLHEGRAFDVGPDGFNLRPMLMQQVYVFRFRVRTPPGLVLLRRLAADLPERADA